MCNYLDERATPIPEDGYGWKIFSRGNNHVSVPEGKIQAFINLQISYPQNEVIKWEEGERGDGFCFFTTRRDARAVKRNKDYKNDLMIRKIRYRRGLGKVNYNGYYKLDEALCKEFEILDIRG